ncbi:hypothetical protein JOQ06_020998 [Pogonophryne albipinna]|uniref:Translin-associated factor X n=1 Tax=Pogonophryne albipinna TaxID=1090488 RepID=A0AAD6BUB8_9TELE|nr:hypothetical protein JOQ06_020998 [Pogonophryne albipinna]
MNRREGEGGSRRNADAAQDREASAQSSSPVIAAFKVFQQELDTKHDKHERLVKISRDVTIESKRTIFLLHRVTSVPNAEDILNEAELKLDAVRQKIGQIAEELRGEDIFQFHRAFTGGEPYRSEPSTFPTAIPHGVVRHAEIGGPLKFNCRSKRIQEYVEAASFLHYIRHRSLISLEEINARLVFMKSEKEDSEGPADALQPGGQVLTFQVSPSDYLLGVADLTGELMRMCISSVGNGDIDTPFQLSQFLRQIHDGFSYIGNTGPYEVSKKLHVLRQSLGKVEDACYALRVRGSEIPKHMLADVFSSRTTHMEPEEGVV